MPQETLSQILGERVTPKLARQVKSIVLADANVMGAFDLALHSYGPERLVGSIHAEVPGTMSVEQIDEMTRRIQQDALAKTNGEVIIAAIGIYSHNTSDEASRVRGEVTRLVMAHDGVLQLHGFHLDEARKAMSFDVILGFEVPSRNEEFAAIVGEVEATYPDYAVNAILDADVSD